MANFHDLKAPYMKPDIITLGKALSGSFTSASGIMADYEITECLEASDIESTFGGNALTMAIVRAAIEVLREERLVDNA
jgi:ornithine--oxo-acid transaminase